MTERRPATGTAAKILATGASVAAGLSLMGLMEGAAAGAAPSTPAAGPTVIRRVVVVPTTVPDVVLQSTLGGGTRVVEVAPSPIIRVRPAPATAQPAGPAVSTSRGS